MVRILENGSLLDYLPPAEPTVFRTLRAVVSNSDGGSLSPAGSPNGGGGGLPDVYFTELVI